MSAGSLSSAGSNLGLKDLMNPRCAAISVFEDVSFPEADYDPPRFAQRVFLAQVTKNVVLDLRHPVPRVGAALQLRSAGCPIPSVPKVAVAKHGHATFGKYDVGSTRETGDMETITKTDPS